MKLKKEIKIDETNINLETVANNCIYSSEEKKIGKWANNKPLYRKIIEIVTGQTTNAWISVAHNIPNVQNIMITKAWFNNGNNDAEVIPNPSTQLAVNNTNIVYVLLADSMKNRHFYIILEYTKTTD